MSFVDVGGITKLSQLQIDADKAWAAFGISNIKEVVLGMAVGDIIYFFGGQIQKLTPGPVGSNFLTKGNTYPPKWGWADTG